MGWATDMFEVSNWGFLGVLSPTRPLHGVNGVPRDPRHVVQVSRVMLATWALFRWTENPQNPYPDPWHMSVAQLIQKLGF